MGDDGTGKVVFSAFDLIGDFEIEAWGMTTSGFQPLQYNMLFSTECHFSSPNMRLCSACSSAYPCLYVQGQCSGAGSSVYQYSQYLHRCHRDDQWHHYRVKRSQSEIMLRVSLCIDAVSGTVPFNCYGTFGMQRSFIIGSDQDTSSPTNWIDDFFVRDLAAPCARGGDSGSDTPANACDGVVVVLLDGESNCTNVMAGPNNTAGPGFAHGGGVERITTNVRAGSGSVSLGDHECGKGKIVLEPFLLGSDFQITTWACLSSVGSFSCSNNGNCGRNYIFTTDYFYGAPELALSIHSSQIYLDVKCGTSTHSQHINSRHCRDSSWHHYKVERSTSQIMLSVDCEVSADGGSVPVTCSDPFNMVRNFYVGADDDTYGPVNFIDDFEIRSYPGGICTPTPAPVSASSCDMLVLLQADHGMGNLATASPAGAGVPGPGVRITTDQAHSDAQASSFWLGTQGYYAFSPMELVADFEVSVWALLPRQTTSFSHFMVLDTNYDTGSLNFYVYYHSSNHYTYLYVRGCTSDPQSSSNSYINRNALDGRWHNFGVERTSGAIRLKFDLDMHSSNVYSSCQTTLFTNNAFYVGRAPLSSHSTTWASVAHFDELVVRDLSAVCDASNATDTVVNSTGPCGDAVLEIDKATAVLNVTWVDVYFFQPLDSSAPCPDCGAELRRVLLQHVHPIHQPPHAPELPQHPQHLPLWPVPAGAVERGGVRPLGHV